MATTPHAAALIDSDVLIDAARGHLEARAFLNDQNRAFRVQISTISAMELIVGCRNKIELSQTRRFLNLFGFSQLTQISQTRLTI